MFRSLHRMVRALALTATVGLAATSAIALDSGWPRTLPVDAGMVTIYAPQVDGLDGDVLRYRAALAWRPSADAEPVFGAGWFESKVNIDRDQRIVHPLDLRITNTRFPAGTADVQTGLAAALAQQAPGWNLDFPLDQLDSALQAAQAESEAQQKLNTAPPQIIYRDHPALLVTLDGEPVLRAIENSPYQAVINTPYPLISDGKHYYLNAAKGVWYRATRATGPYAYDTKPPADIVAMVKPDEAGEAGEAGQAPAEPVTSANAPEIVVSTVPAELIVTEGPAAFVPLVDDLLVLQNSDDDVFMHVSSQQYYIVLAGRWYRARSLNGPWTWQAADQLPPAFANIPQNSEQADSRVYVAGTPEAEEAVLDAQVPQTAAVARGPADIDVAYDGEPEFEPVDGTDLEYATNTGATVLESDRQYYLVEDGVWYVSATPNGPWEVSAWRPDAVDAIAPTSPVYNVKYVYIYDHTPDVVYVGYTPGYLGSYVYYDTVVYGTGWYYRPWVTPYYYYPRPSTWGFHVSYNPWYGWGFGLSWNWGWGWGWPYYGPYYGSYYGPYYCNFYAGGYWHQNHYWHHDHYGYWGPRGYRPHHGHHGYRGDDYAYGRDRHGDGRYDDRDGRSGDDYAYGGRHDNLYRDGRQRARVVNTTDNPRRGLATEQVYAARDKNGFSRNQPLKPSDLRMKAQVRDANVQASRKTLLADTSGKVYEKAARRETRPITAEEALRQRAGQPTKAAQNRTTPVTAKGGGSASRKNGAVAAGKASQPVKQVAGQTARQPGMQPAKQAANQSVKQRDKQASGQSVKQAARQPAKLAAGSTAAQVLRRSEQQAATRAASQQGQQQGQRQEPRQAQQLKAPDYGAKQQAPRQLTPPAGQQQSAPPVSRAARQSPVGASAPVRQSAARDMGQGVRQKAYETFSAPPQQRQAPPPAAAHQQGYSAPQGAPASAMGNRGHSAPPPAQQAPRGGERASGELGGGPRHESGDAGGRRGQLKER